MELESSQAGRLSLAEFRSLFPALRDVVWLDTPGCPPGATPVIEAVRRCLDEWEAGRSSWMDWDQVPDTARTEIAGWLNVSPANIALVDSVSHAAAQVAAGLPAGSRVLVTEGEFRSNLLPWQGAQSRGISVTTVPLGPPGTTTERVCAALRQGADLLAISTCVSSTGNRPDLAEIARVARANGVRIFVDATQSLGVIQLDIAAIQPDYLAAHAYKWMFAPRGCAWLYVGDGCLDQLVPIAPGWHSAQHPHDEYFGPLASYPDAARRLDGGRPWLPWIGGLAAFQTLNRLDPAEVEGRALALSEKARAGLVELGIPVRPSELPSQIVRMTPVNSADLVSHLVGARIQCSGGRAGLRVGFHGFNDEEDLDRLLAAVQSWQRGVR
jgi:selenocysteine lyase/cysteine desulfurase